MAPEAAELVLTNLGELLGVVAQGTNVLEHGRSGFAILKIALSHLGLMPKILNLKRLLAQEIAVVKEQKGADQGDWYDYLLNTPTVGYLLGNPKFWDLLKENDAVVAQIIQQLAPKIAAIIGSYAQSDRLKDLWASEAPTPDLRRHWQQTLMTAIGSSPQALTPIAKVLAHICHNMAGEVAEPSREQALRDKLEELGFSCDSVSTVLRALGDTFAACANVQGPLQLTLTGQASHVLVAANPPALEPLLTGLSKNPAAFLSIAQVWVKHLPAATEAYGIDLASPNQTELFAKIVKEIATQLQDGKVRSNLQKFLQAAPKDKPVFLKAILFGQPSFGQPSFGQAILNLLTEYHNAVAPMANQFLRRHGSGAELPVGLLEDAFKQARDSWKLESCNVFASHLAVYWGQPIPVNASNLIVAANRFILEIANGPDFKARFDGKGYGAFCQKVVGSYLSEKNAGLVGPHGPLLKGIAENIFATTLVDWSRFFLAFGSLTKQEPNASDVQSKTTLEMLLSKDSFRDFPSDEQVNIATAAILLLKILNLPKLNDANRQALIKLITKAYRQNNNSTQEVPIEFLAEILILALEPKKLESLLSKKAKLKHFLDPKADDNEKEENLRPLIQGLYSLFCENEAIAEHVAKNSHKLNELIESLLKGKQLPPELAGLMGSAKSILKEKDEVVKLVTALVLKKPLKAAEITKNLIIQSQFVNVFMNLAMTYVLRNLFAARPAG